MSESKLIQVKKLFGDRPDNVHVLNTIVHFDTEGVAEVNEVVASVLKQIPGYEILSIKDEPAEVITNEPVQEETVHVEENSKEPELNKEEPSESAEEKKPTRPSRPAPRRAVTKK